MHAFSPINVAALLDTLVCMLAAFLLGGVIGFERQYRQRTAGLRTNVLVAVGASIFVDTASRLHGNEGAVHVLAYVVSGIGFLGAGVIMREEGNIRGINTAATLWGSAAVGACAGAKLIPEAILGTVFVLAANTLLRPIVNAINRKPLDNTNTEVTHTIYVIAHRSEQKKALAVLEQALEEMNFPLSELDIRAFGPTEVEIEATLLATSIAADELDRLTSRLATESSIAQAFWSPSTTE